MLTIDHLTVKMKDQIILKDFNLSVPAGEVHALMGPNGSGKSTLASVIAGKPEYQVVSGTIHFNGQDLLAMSPEERSFAGIFLAMQYPIEIPGISNSYFIKAALNAHLKHRGEQEIDIVEFSQLINAKLKILNMPESLLDRSVNQGFSGGEKKCNEILQLLVLAPLFAILDETDSGLDIDTLKIVANAVNSLRAEDRGILVITHYQRLLEYIKPDVIHIMQNGTVIKTGDRSLAQILETQGYAHFTPTDEG